jgi:hypothetical protein
MRTRWHGAKGFRPVLSPEKAIARIGQPVPRQSAPLDGRLPRNIVNEVTVLPTADSLLRQQASSY